MAYFGAELQSDKKLQTETLEKNDKILIRSKSLGSAKVIVSQSVHSFCR